MGTKRSNCIKEPTFETRSLPAQTGVPRAADRVPRNPRHHPGTGRHTPCRPGEQTARLRHPSVWPRARLGPRCAPRAPPRRLRGSDGSRSTSRRGERHVPSCVTSGGEDLPSRLRQRPAGPQSLGSCPPSSPGTGPPGLRPRPPWLLCGGGRRPGGQGAGRPPGPRRPRRPRRIPPREGGG